MANLLSHECDQAQLRKAEAQDLEVLHCGIVKMTVSVIRGDEHKDVFENSKRFAAERWATAIEALDLGNADRTKAQIIDAYDKFGKWLFQSIDESLSPAQKGHLQTLQLLSSPLRAFTNTFENLVDPETVDMSILWGLIYLNVKLALASNNEMRPVNEKLKRVTQWLVFLRRAIESLNQCVTNCRDLDSARREITEVFEPMLLLLTEMVQFQHTYKDAAVFRNATGSMTEKVKANISEIEDVVTHFRQISEYSKADQELSAKPLAGRGLAFREPQDPNDFTAFPVDNVPQQLRKKFYGRDASLRRIDACLGDQNKEALRTYLMYGRRGVGKTQIALEYARQYKNKYDAVFWVRCETSASLRKSFADIAVRLEVPGADPHGHFQENQVKVLTWLKQTKKTWLLIFDNAEKEQLLDAYWPKDNSTHGSILITSRSYYNFENKEVRNGETVSLFNEEERWELLMELLGEEWQNEHLNGKHGTLERYAAKELMSKLDGLALAIAQAANLILETRITKDQSVHTLLQLFEQNRMRLPTRQLGHRDTVNHALDTIWSVSLNALTPNARRLLGVFAMLSPDSIPMDLFLPSDQTRLNGSLDFCKQTDPTKNATEMSEGMQNAIKELKAADLIQQDNREFFVHRVIQEAMNFEDIYALKEAFDATTQVLSEAFPHQELGRPMHKDWPFCQMYVQHVHRLAGQFVQIRKGQAEPFRPSRDFVSLLARCGWYLFEIADGTECLKLMDIARSALDESLQKSLLHARILNTEGSARFELNQLKSARTAFEAAREIRVALLGPEDPLVASILANCGNVESAEGNLEEADYLFVEAARIRETYGDREALMLGLTYMQRGRVWYLKGEYFRAFEMYNKADACFKKKSGQDQVHLADLYYAQGNLELARKDYNQAKRYYDMCRDLGQKNQLFSPLVVATNYKLGCVEHLMGNTDKALFWLEKAYTVADIRSPGEIDGAIARIQWKRAEILQENVLRRDEGLELKRQMMREHGLIAAKLQLSIDHDDLSSDKAFDVLVSGYFR